MNKTYFNEYKRIKSILKGRLYKGYPLDMVLGSYIALNVWGGFSWKKYLRQSLFYFRLNLPDNRIIATYSTEREDYHELIQAYLGSKVERCYVRVENKKTDLIRNPLNNVIYFVKAIFISLNLNGSFKDKMLLVPLISLACKVVDDLEKKSIKCEKYIAFNSSYLIESFLSYYFRKRNIPTYSLQHGMYFDYIQVVPKDIINFENVCADVQLLWGQYSYDQVNRNMPDRTKGLVYGYPFDNSEVESKKESPDIYVLLPRDIYWQSSKQLLNKLKCISSKENFLIRPHPSIKSNFEDWLTRVNNNNFTLDDAVSLDEQLKKTTFKAVISFNSTAAFQALWHDQNVLIYASEDDEFENPGFNSFSKEDDLGKILQEYLAQDYDDMRKLKNYCFKKVDNPFLKVTD